MKNSLTFSPESTAELEQQELYAADGTDLSLIRWMLSLTPKERLLHLQSQARSLAQLHDAAKSR